MFGSKRRKFRKELSKRFEGCDYEMAKRLVIEKLGGGVLPNELVHWLDKFTKNPCLDTATDLIAYDIKFLAFFELSTPESIYHMNKKLEE